MPWSWRSSIWKQIDFCLGGNPLCCTETLLKWGDIDTCLRTMRSASGYFEGLAVHLFTDMTSTQMAQLYFWLIFGLMGDIINENAWFFTHPIQIVNWTPETGIQAGTVWKTPRLKCHWLVSINIINVWVWICLQGLRKKNNTILVDFANEDYSMEYIIRNKTSSAKSGIYILGCSYPYSWLYHMISQLWTYIYMVILQTAMFDYQRANPSYGCYEIPSIYS